MTKPHRKRPRRALSHQGGEARRWGEPEAARALAECLAVDEEPTDRLTHGFHSYPARMHWAIAQRALSHFAPPEGRVLDPFCGSGTVLVEARIQGLRGLGLDLNPLALRLSALKTSAPGAHARAALLEAARAVAAASEERVRSRAPAVARLPKRELRWYGPHVLKELAGLLEEIEQVPDPRQREALTLVFSSNITKVSTQQGDSSPQATPKRIRKGLVTEFFLRRCEELCERWAAYRPLVTGPAARLREGDARRLGRRVRGPIDLILTSPPYGGTYDYVAHHQRRFAWLGIDPQPLARGEIGARRRGDDAARFDRELSEVLRGMAKALAPDGRALLLMGDGQLGGQRVPADAQLRALAPAAGLRLVAAASQPRPDFTGGPTRREHLLLLAPC